MQKALVEQACAAGSTIEAHVYPGLGHSATVNRSFTDSRVLARRVMAGEPVAGTCPAVQTLSCSDRIVALSLS